MFSIHFLIKNYWLKFFRFHNIIPGPPPSTMSKTPLRCIFDNDHVKKSTIVWGQIWSAFGAEPSGLKHMPQQWLPTSSSGQECIWSLAQERLTRIQKITKTSLIEGIPINLGKSKSMKTQISQYRTCKAPWPKHWWPQGALHCHAPLWIKDSPQFWKVLIKPCPVILEGEIMPAGNGYSRFLPLWEHYWPSSGVHQI